VNRASRRTKTERKAARCLQCGGAHHTWALIDTVMADVRQRTGGMSSIHDAVIGDGVYHITIDAYRLLQAAGQSHEETIAVLLGKDGPAASIGSMLGAMDSRARQMGRREGVEAFFAELVAHAGPGRYEIEIDERGHTTPTRAN